MAHDHTWLAGIGNGHLFPGLTFLATDVQGGGDCVRQLCGWSGHGRNTPLVWFSVCCGRADRLPALDRIGTPSMRSRANPRKSRPGLHFAGIHYTKSAPGNGCPLLKLTAKIHYNKMPAPFQ
jgi:hypothetical protein